MRKDNIEASGPSTATAQLQAPKPVSVEPPPIELKNLQDLVDALPETQIKLRSDIERYVRPIRFRRGSLTIELISTAPPAMIGKMVSAIKGITGELWIISTEKSGGGPTLAELRQKAKKDQAEKDRAHPAFSHSLLKNAQLLAITEIENHNVIQGDFGTDPRPSDAEDEED